MKTIQLQIDDKNYDSFLIILNNLKDGLINNFIVKDNDGYIDTVSDKEHKYYENLLNNMSDDDKTISYKHTSLHK